MQIPGHSSANDIDVIEASRRIDDGALLLDVRTAEEWEAGHADGATHIELTTLPARLPSLKPERPITVICRSGARSAQAVGFLCGNGYEAVNIAGGMLAWHAAGKPVVDNSGNTGAVI